MGKVNTIINIVPHQEAWVVERFDQIEYAHTLKEVSVNIDEQTAITNDNVSLDIDAVLFYQIIDPYKASYEIEDPKYAIQQIAQTTMRSEIGKLSLDEVFRERNCLNYHIVETIKGAVDKWGIECKRYEIRNVTPPKNVIEAMQLQVEAERKKRAAILESEGIRESSINKATGEGKALKISAESKAEAFSITCNSLRNENSSNALSYLLAQKYLEGLRELAKETTSIVVPADLGNVNAIVAQAMAISKFVNSSSNSS